MGTTAIKVVALDMVGHELARAARPLCCSTRKRQVQLSRILRRWQRQSVEGIATVARQVSEHGRQGG